MSTAGPNARIVPLKQSICWACAVAYLLIPAAMLFWAVWGLSIIAPGVLALIKGVFA